jgi:hypothetical protein
MKEKIIYKNKKYRISYEKKFKALIFIYFIL